MSTSTRRTDRSKTIRFALPIGVPGTLGFLEWATCRTQTRGDLVTEALYRAGIVSRP